MNGLLVESCGVDFFSGLVFCWKALLLECGFEFMGG